VLYPLSYEGSRRRQILNKSSRFRRSAHGRAAAGVSVSGVVSLTLQPQPRIELSQYHVLIGVGDVAEKAEFGQRAGVRDFALQRTDVDPRPSEQRPVGPAETQTGERLPHVHRSSAMTFEKLSAWPACTVNEVSP
jgi:hypothetical protein